MIEDRKQKIVIDSVAHIILIFVAACCFLPFFLVVSASFTTESSLIKYGYRLIPKVFSIEAYKMVFQNSSQLVSSYGVTIFVTVVGSLLSIFFTALTAYPLARKDYRWRKGIGFYFYFTMLFSGGAIPSYILISKYLNMKNNIWVLIIPCLLSVWNVFLLRTYFSKIHSSLYEAAKIDGAGEWRIFLTIVLPMSITGLATVLLLIALMYWNEWYLCLMYMSNEKIISLQYFLYRTMSNIDSILKNQNSTVGVTTDLSNMPSETARMAMCVLAAGPMIFVFMFFQKYFIKGINVGSVKG